MSQITYCELAYHDIIDALDKEVLSKGRLNEIIKEYDFETNKRLKKVHLFVKWYEKNKLKLNDYAMHDIYRKFFSETHKNNFKIKPFYLKHRRTCKC